MTWTRRDSAGPFVTMSVDGAEMAARSGEPVAVSLLATGRLVFGRSVKYHRPRGPLCMRARCDGCLMRVNGVPNVMTCATPAHEGCEVSTQNVLGSAKVDVLAAADWFFSEGMDHHHMFTRFGPVNRAMQKVARRVAGIGTLPEQPLGPVPVRDEVVDVLVVGGGPSGVTAANSAARAGVRVALVEELEVRGALGPPVAAHPHASALAVFDEPAAGFRAIRDEARSERWVLIGDEHGITRCRARAIVVATGAQYVLEPIAGIDRPGVFHVAAAETLLATGLVPSGPVALVGEARGFERVMEALGAHVVGVFEPERVTSISGRPSVRALEVDGAAIACELVIVAGRRSAVFELAAQAGAEVCWREGGFRILADDDGRTAHPGTFATGACVGRSRDAGHATRAGALAAEAAS